PPITNGSSISASLGRGQDLDPIVVGQPGGRPPAARDDLVVNGHGHSLPALPELGDHVVDGRALRQIAVSAVDGHAHANRPGENGAISSGGVPVASSSAMASAVTGVSSTPLR